MMRPAPAQHRLRPAKSAPKDMGTVVRAILLGLALMAVADVAQADFGVLFFSPAQREALDHAPTGTLEAAPSRTPEAALPQRIDGILRRPDGRDTVWLNGEPSARPAGLRLAPAGALALIPDSAPAVRLRVGDSWPPASASPESASAAHGSSDNRPAGAFGDQALWEQPLPSVAVTTAGAAR